MSNDSLKRKQYFRLMLFPVVLSVMFLYSCVKEVKNIKLPPSDPKLVVGCFISPQDTVIALTLKRSSPLFGSGNGSSQHEPVTGASVIISGNAGSVQLNYNSKRKQYEASKKTFPISGGETYNLTISTPQGEKVSATCQVPPSNISSLTIDFADTLSASKIIMVKWQDIPGQSNQYVVYAQTEEFDAKNEDTLYVKMTSDEPTQRDTQKDGMELSSRLERGRFNDEQHVISYTIHILNVDVNYFLYKRSLDNYKGDDPFSEPSLMYTNIKGGIGIFAAYQKYSVWEKVK